MTTNSGIKEDIQSLEVGSEYIELYIIDASAIGDTTYYATPSTLSGSPSVDFNGVTYYSLPMEVEGMEMNNEGKLPRPKIRVANVNSTFLAGIINYNDLVGAKVSRMRTYKKYLDGEAAADPSAEFPRDIFYIEQKTRQTAQYIEWELISAIDIENIFLPVGQVTSFCSLKYGIGEDWQQCPYDGDPGGGGRYYDIEGEVTTSDNDACGKRLFDCRLRFDGSTGYKILPFKGFPAIGQLKYPYRR